MSNLLGYQASYHETNPVDLTFLSFDGKKAREMALHYWSSLCPIMEVPTILFYTGIATKRK